MNPHQERFKSIEISDNSKELGFCIASKYQKNGYMNESLLEIIKYSFEILKLDNLYACNNISNIASSKIQEKCNFSIIGTHQYIDYLNNNKNIIIERRINKEDYFSNIKLNRVK